MALLRKIHLAGRTPGMEASIREFSGADLLAALRLQIEWGADEALEDAPVNRLRVPAREAVSLAAPSVPASGDVPPVLPVVSQPGKKAPVLIQATQAVARAGQAAVTAGDLAALRAAIAGFDGCALRDTATSLVFAEGDPSAGLLLVGDAPGADEDRAGRPFAGAAGAWLDRMLASIGLTRAQTLLAPLIPWRPPGDRPPSPAELAVCLPFLLRLIVLSRPRHIVLFSALAARALLPAVQRRRPRGTWVALAVPGLDQPVPVLPTGGIAAVMQTAAQRREAWADLRRLSRALNSANPPQ